MSMDNHRPEAAKKLIIKARVAARKSGDAKLNFKVTRAVMKPEAVRQILAEKDN